MRQGESMTVFDGRKNSATLFKADNDGGIEISISGISGQAKFYACPNVQNFIIEHFLSFNPDSERIVLKRMSYELQTMQNHFDRLIEKYHKVCEELEQLR